MAWEKLKCSVLFFVNITSLNNIYRPVSVVWAFQISQRGNLHIADHTTAQCVYYLRNNLLHDTKVL